MSNCSFCNVWIQFTCINFVYTSFLAFNAYTKFDKPNKYCAHKKIRFCFVFEFYNISLFELNKRRVFIYTNKEKVRFLHHNDVTRGGGVSFRQRVVFSRKSHWKARKRVSWNNSRKLVIVPTYISRSWTRSTFLVSHSHSWELNTFRLHLVGKYPLQNRCKSLGFCRTIRWMWVRFRKRDVCVLCGCFLFLAENQILKICCQIHNQYLNVFNILKRL